MERRIDYGLDGPGVVRAFWLTGALILVIAIGGALALQGGPFAVVCGLLIGGAVLAAYCFVNALLMIWSSRRGKFSVRDRLVEALHLTGAERVLDVGCGRGLVLIEVAKRLTTGQAIGVDLWLSKDLTGNRPQSTLENASIAGVADRVTVETGDMCALPFPASTFDAVASMTAIHNVPGEARRNLALSEIARVLKPGGRLAIFDVFHSLDYARVLRAAGMDVETSGLFLLWGVPGRRVFGRKPSNGV
jgi:arsenite methyltransferase